MDRRFRRAIKFGVVPNGRAILEVLITQIRAADPRLPAADLVGILWPQFVLAVSAAMVEVAEAVNGYQADEEDLSPY